MPWGMYDEMEAAKAELERTKQAVGALATVQEHKQQSRLGYRPSDTSTATATATAESLTAGPSNTSGASGKRRQ